MDAIYFLAPIHRKIFYPPKSKMRINKGQVIADIEES